MDNEIAVIKRDGSKEVFEEKHIEAVLTAAGLSADGAMAVAKGVHERIKLLGVKEISSLQVRDIVLDQLRMVNQKVADLYQWYESTKK